MKLQIAAPLRGAVWVRQGFAVFSKQPLAFSGVFVAYMLALFMLAWIPIVGTFLLVAGLPLVTLGFMVATRNTARGGTPLPSAIVEPLRTGRAQHIALAKLGLGYAAGTLFIMALSNFADGGALEGLIRTMGEANASAEKVAERLQSPELLFGMVLRFGLAAALSLPFWHAPALIHWGGLGAVKSLFFSTMACWRNKAAFVVYALTWAVVIVGMSLVANLLLLAVGQARLLGLIAMPASLLFSTVFYASLYFTFADCFVQDDNPTTIQESL